MAFSGPAPSHIAVVGEAPGKTENEMGKPFVGPSGAKARDWLSLSGVDPEDVAWLNVVSCFPNRTPTKEEVRVCRGNLDAQLDLIAPEYILVLGGVAVSSWWPQQRIGELRGLWWSAKYGEGRKALALATWHPAATLRNPSLETEARLDVARFRLGLEVLTFNREMMCLKGCGEKAVSWDDEKGLGWCLRHKK